MMALCTRVIGLICVMSLATVAADTDASKREAEKLWQVGLFETMLISDTPAIRALGVIYRYRKAAKSNTPLSTGERDVMNADISNLLDMDPDPETLRRLFIEFCTPAQSIVCDDHQLAAIYLASDPNNMNTYLDLMALPHSRPFTNPLSGEDILPEHRQQWLMSQAMLAPNANYNPFHATDLMATLIKDYAAHNAYPQHISAYDDRVTDDNLHYVLTAGYNAGFSITQSHPISEYCTRALNQRQTSAIEQCKVIALRLQQSRTTLFQVLTGLSLQQSIIKALHPGSSFEIEFDEHAVRQRAVVDCLATVLDEDILLSDLGQRYFRRLSAHGEVDAMTFLLEKRADMTNEMQSLCSFTAMNYPDTDITVSNGDVR